jgi:flagellar biosynthesis regulator FlbT
MVDTICKSISIKPENIKTEEEFKEYVAQLSGVILHAQVLLAKSIEEMVYNGNIFAKVWMLPPYKQLIDFDDELFEIQARNRGIDKEDVNDDEFPDDEDDEFEDDDDEDEWD